MVDEYLKAHLRHNPLLGPRTDPVNWLSGFRAENASRESFAPEPADLDELRSYFEKLSERGRDR